MNDLLGALYIVFISLLGDALKDQETLEKIFGDNKAEQERKLKERLERRKQRIAEGRLFVH